MKSLPNRAFSLPDMPAILTPAVPPNPAIESANPGGQGDPDLDAEVALE
jgi:hypothetical protein